MHESCGQCTPCREGLPWVYDIMCRMERGQLEEREVDMLMEIGSQIELHTICGLADAAIWPIEGLMRTWKNDILERCRHPENYHPEDYFQRAWRQTPRELSPRRLLPESLERKETISCTFALFPTNT